MDSPPSISIEAKVFGAIALAGLAARFLLVPWDFGGCFFQAWLSALGLSGFGSVLPRMRRVPRLLARFTLIPVAGCLVFGSVYFAAQALFPYLFAGLVATGAFWLWSKTNVLLGALAVLAPLPLLAPYCSYGARHMALIMQIRGLDGSTVRQVRFTPTARDGEPTVVDDPLVLASIAESLRCTSPYSPNHEPISKAWRCEISLADGGAISFSVGKGNRAHAETVCLTFGVEVYQNPVLYRALGGRGVRLWHDAPGPCKGEAPGATSRDAPSIDRAARALPNRGFW